MTSQPDTPGRKRGRGVLWLAIAGLVVAIGVAAAWWRVQVLAERALQVMAQEVEGTLTAARSENGRRPVLVGPAQSGSAWPEYQQALAHMSTRPPALSEYPRVTDIPLDALQRLIDDHRVALDHLVRGTAREDGQFPYEWELGALMDGPDVIGARTFSTLIRAAAQLSSQTGDAEAAVNWLLRGCQLARDLGHNGTLVADAASALGVGECLEDLAAIIDAGALEGGAMTRLAAQLELLDASRRGRAGAATRRCSWVSSCTTPAPRARSASCRPASSSPAGGICSRRR